MSDVPFDGRALPQWYDDAKFGIFIHWGPYAVPCYAPVDYDMGDLFAKGDWQAVYAHSPYTEWYQNSQAIDGSPVNRHHAATYGERGYESFVDEFHTRSAGTSMADWVPLFAAAGARYVVPVTKHHDGFVMWDTATPNPHRERWTAERDHIGELAAASRAAGMRLGVYYSGGIDWTFQPPPIRDLAGMFTGIPNTPEYGEYATAHVLELIERFSPSLLWGDIGWPWHLDPNDLFTQYYAAVPDGVVNDRWNMIAARGGTLHADFVTPEYSTEAPAGRKFEVCRGIGRSFGYNRMETAATMLAVDDLVWMLADIVANGGNLLLNVGPTADGQIPLAQADRLLALGWWLRINGDAIYATRAGGVVTAADGRDVALTHGADGRRFAIVRGAPSGTLSFPMSPGGEGSEVHMLGNPRSLPHRWHDGTVEITLPDHLPEAPATAFVLEG